MSAQLVSAVSVLVALGAVWVAIWQVRMNIRQTERINSLPVISAAFNEYRSPEFRAQLDGLMRDVPSDTPDGGFAALPAAWRESAYRVCYLFDYLGALIAHRLVDERIIIGVFATQAMQLWHVMEPLIRAERRYRAAHYSPYVSPGFLAYYEHLVKRVIDLGGRDAPARIRSRAGVLSLATPTDADAGRGEKLPF